MVNKNLLYHFLKSGYEKSLISGGTDSQIFTAETKFKCRYNIISRTDDLKKFIISREGKKQSITVIITIESNMVRTFCLKRTF